MSVNASNSKNMFAAHNMTVYNINNNYISINPVKRINENYEPNGIYPRELKSTLMETLLSNDDRQSSDNDSSDVEELPKLDLKLALVSPPINHPNKAFVANDLMPLYPGTYGMEEISEQVIDHGITDVEKDLSNEQRSLRSFDRRSFDRRSENENDSLRSSEWDQFKRFELSAPILNTDYPEIENVTCLNQKERLSYLIFPLSKEENKLLNKLRTVDYHRALRIFMCNRQLCNIRKITFMKLQKLKSIDESQFEQVINTLIKNRPEPKLYKWIGTKIKN